ncbi:hypothetical protein DL93DRAFT_1207066, partial [Clavulina sp. PMI_390]
GGPSPTRAPATPASHSSDDAQSDEPEAQEPTPTGSQFPNGAQPDPQTPGSNLSIGDAFTRNPFEDSPLFDLPFPHHPPLHDGRRHLNFRPIPENLRSLPFRVYVEPGYPTRGLSTARRNLWAEAGASSSCVFGVILSDKITESSSTHIYQNVTSAIRRAFPDSPDVEISLPDTTLYGREGAIKEIPGMNCRTAILISNLSILTAAVLEHYQLWISEAVRFIALPCPLPPSPFIGTFSGLPFLPEDEAKVLAIFHKGYLDSYDIVAFFHANNLDLSETVKSMAVRSVKLSTRGGGHDSWSWNLYTKPPSNDIKVHEAYRTIVRNTTFVAFGGSAEYKKPFIPCSTCRSEDHPQGHCPLRPILDDLDASIMERQAPNASTQGPGTAPGGNRGRGRGQGARGRGRGHRGGRGRGA